MRNEMLLRAKHNFYQQSVWLGIDYLFGNFVFFTSYWLLFSNKTISRSSSYFSLVTLISHSFLFASLGLQTLVYVCFNRPFRQTLAGFFR